MTCCGVRLPAGRRHCAFCRRTIRLIRERRCVACAAPVIDWGRVEGRCGSCLSRHVKLNDSTRHLLILAAKSRYKAAVAA